MIALSGWFRRHVYGVPALMLAAFPVNTGLNTFGPIPTMEPVVRVAPPMTYDAIGIDTSVFAQTASRLIERTIRAGATPGAALVVVHHGAIAFSRGYGHIDWSTGSPAVSPDRTVYDLASLTKVVSTTSVIMHLVDSGVMHLNDPVQKWVPDFQGPHKSEVQIQNLLTHTSGLPADRDLGRATTKEQARALVVTTNLRCHPGKCFVYSDLGADVLGFAAEAAANEPLDTLLARTLTIPLGMSHTTFHADTIGVDRLAPTEGPRGRVHDGNAAALGGVTGHAGLFSTATDLAQFALLYLNHGEAGQTQIYSPEAISDFTRRTFGTRALGWDTCDSTATISTCGRHWSPRAFGHTGFTGTSIWIDPDRDMAVILLTNRVHDATAKRPATALRDLRADIADVAAASVTDMPSRTVLFASHYRSDIEHLWQTPIRRARPHRKHPVRLVRKSSARGHVARGR